MTEVDIIDAFFSTQVVFHRNPELTLIGDN